MELRALLWAKPLSRDDLYRLLQRCVKHKNVLFARQAHCLMLSNNLHLVSALADVLIRFFASRGCLLDAYLVFCGVSQPSLYTWHAIISALTTLGHYHRALELWREMQEEHGIQPDKVAFLCILKACGCLQAIQQGSLVYKQLIITSHLQSARIQSALILMYAKCSSLDNARRVFDAFPNEDVVIWGTMLGAYAQHGDGVAALNLYSKMHEQGIQPDQVTFLCILKAVNCVEDIIVGKMVHQEITLRELELDVVLGSTLIDMYAKCGGMEDAQVTFNLLPSRNVVTWNAIITGYAQHGHGYCALDLYAKFQEQRVMKPEKVTFLCTLKACGCIGAIMEGRLLHDQIVRFGIDEDTALESTLIDMYAKCGSLDEAGNLFSKVHNLEEVVSWNSLLGGYVQQGQALQALRLFQSMQNSGLPPDIVTFACVLKACSTIEALEFGQLLHDQIVRSSIEPDVVVGSALMDMYCKCKHVNDGRRVFDNMQNANVVAWNAVISGYVQAESEHEALVLFQQMLQKDIEPNDVTFSSILKACNNLGNIEEMKLAHDGIIRCGLEVDAILVCALVDTYAKCGSPRESFWVFDRLPNRNVAAWAALIGGYVQNKSSFNAFKMFERMQSEGVKPDKVIFLSVLKASSMSGAIQEGMLIHDQVVREDYGSDIALGNTLVDVYCKCGRLNEACKVFYELPMRDIVSWGAMITGYTQQGDGFAALDLYEKLEADGKEPERSTIVSILKACSNVGALEQGKFVHEKIVRQAFDDDLVIGNALVDMYAKCGRIKDASKVMLRVSSKDSVSWNAMIAGYAMQGNYELAMLCLRDMQQHGLEPDSYSLTSVIAACSHAGDVQACLALFEGMRMQQGLVPNLEEFNCMVDAFGRSGFLDGAKELLHSMPGLPDKTGWVSLLASSKTHGNLNVGGHCLNGITEPDQIPKSSHFYMSCSFSDFKKPCILEPGKLQQCMSAQEKAGRTESRCEGDVRGPCLEACSFDEQVKKAAHVPDFDANLELATHKYKEKGSIALGFVGSVLDSHECQDPLYNVESSSNLLCLKRDSAKMSCYQDFICVAFIAIEFFIL